VYVYMRERKNAPLHYQQTSTVNGVAIHRPLLALGKDEILDFAHRFGVPYFKVGGLSRLIVYTHIYACIYMCVCVYVYMCIYAPRFGVPYFKVGVGVWGEGYPFFLVLFVCACVYMYVYILYMCMLSHPNSHDQQTTIHLHTQPLKLGHHPHLEHAWKVAAAPAPPPRRRVRRGRGPQSVATGAFAFAIVSVYVCVCGLNVTTKTITTTRPPNPTTSVPSSPITCWSRSGAPSSKPPWRCMSTAGAIGTR